MMGDSQLSDPGFGPPVDALDTTCRRYKDCLRYKKIPLRQNTAFGHYQDVNPAFRCAMTNHGDLCVKEYTKYELSGADSGFCGLNREDSCERALCECDLQPG